MLDAQRLANALEAARAPFNDVDVTDIPAARRQIALAEATAIIKEFVEHGEVRTPATGLFAPNGPVTGAANGGKIY